MTSARVARGWLRAGLGACLLWAAPVASQAAAPPPFGGMTEREVDFLTLWQLRVGLNVSALQCQYSPFLRLPDTYNAFLRQHADELAQAYRGLESYFRRMVGPRLGPRRFDTENTKLYQNFSPTLTQRPFCEHAALLARRALAVPKGGATRFAREELPPFLAFLEPASLPPSPLMVPLTPVRVPDLSRCRPGRRC
ncbi:MAG: hypothetical protein NZM40_05570 [Sphingomonadaceae bacterium]|uniref:hypothetical protein n=1 Tax=Thermaurantiacus sp. TaxID=2820283 RepID=UPI00298EE5B3|nr:hypothetical protein [Thermaurantiacus sp.]MCS6986886.1 hypothetical protein [Sphingomonadaceae bacterium]MDW8415514.1 hypothetical protein [Thermaurantiacus sp.]